MALQRFTLNYGKGTVSFGLPEEQMLGEIVGHPYPAVEADRLILTGGTIYHYMSGYGGGRKSVLPGLSHIDTIRQNHVLGLAPEVGGGSNPQSASRITRGNPLHEDMMEIAGFVQPDFLVNIVPTLEGGVAGVFAGNWASAWQEATRLVDRIFGVPQASLTLPVLKANHA